MNSVKPFEERAKAFQRDLRSLERKHLCVNVPVFKQPKGFFKKKVGKLGLILVKYSQAQVQLGTADIAKRETT